MHRQLELNIALNNLQGVWIAPLTDASWSNWTYMYLHNKTALHVFIYTCGCACVFHMLCVLCEHVCTFTSFKLDINIYKWFSALGLQLRAPLQGIHITCTFIHKQHACIHDTDFSPYTRTKQSRGNLWLFPLNQSGFPINHIIDTESKWCTVFYRQWRQI